MRHKVKKIMIARKDQDHTKSLIRNLLTSLIIYGKIETTLKRANILKSVVNKVLYRAFSYDQDFNAIRYLNSVLFHELASRRVLEELKPKYKGQTNFVRVVKNGVRKGDAAPKAIIEFI